MLIQSLNVLFECQAPTYDIIKISSMNHMAGIRTTMGKRQDNIKQDKIRLCKPYVDTKSIEYPRRDDAKTMQRQCKDDAKTMQRQCKDNAKTMQRQCKDNAKTMQRQCKDNEKTMQRQCKDNAKTMPQEFAPEVANFPHFKGC